MAHRLIVGVTGPSRGIPWAWLAIRWQLRRLGVDGEYLTPASGYPSRAIGAFIISGGNDVDPAIYGGDVSASPSVDPLRDEFELSVLDEARRRELPVLGICRGMQLLNVHAMGTLVSDLKPYRALTFNKGTLLPRKVVRVKSRSILHDWLGKTCTKVNSLHHQAVDAVGKGLAVSARDRDGIIQAIESVNGPLRVGVQWHPEYLPYRQEQRRLFARFLAACGAGEVLHRAANRRESTAAALRLANGRRPNRNRSDYNTIFRDELEQA